MFIITTNKLINRRLFTVLLLGFSSGLPLALTGSTLQAWFTSEHLSLMTIGTLSFLGLPYTFKFLWAPLIDHFCPTFLGRYRGWILIMQASLIVALLMLANIDPVSQTVSLGFIALIVAFCSASQDIAIDAYRTNLLTKEELGLGSSYFVFAYRCAMLLSGGLALAFAGYFGWKLTYELMAVFILIAMIPTYFAPSVESYQSLPNLYQTIVASVRDFLERDKILILLLFVMLYKFGDALALSLMTNFLLNGLGFTLLEVGLAYKLVSFIAVILGGFVAGVLLIRMNIYNALLLFGLAQTFSNLTFVLLAMVGKSFYFMTISIFIENFCSGLSTAAFFAFLMSFCNHRYSATQYALLSATASLGRIILGPIAALMVESLGWIQFYFYSFLLCFPGIFLLMLIKDEVGNYAPAQAN